MIKMAGKQLQSVFKIRLNNTKSFFFHNKVTPNLIGNNFLKNQFNISQRYNGTVRNFSTSPPKNYHRHKIVVFVSSVRPNRMADRVVKFVENSLAKHGMDTILFDPLKMKFEMLQTPIHYYQKPADVPGWLKDANEQLKIADGFLIVTAEYNTFPPPALTNMLSHFPADSYRHRPCGLMSYSMGALGGYRATTIIRPLLCEFCMVPIGISVPIPTVQNLISEDGKCSSELVETSTRKLIKEIGWYSDALKNHKKLTPPVFD